MSLRQFLVRFCAVFHNHIVQSHNSRKGNVVHKILMIHLHGAYVDQQVFLPCTLTLVEARVWQAIILSEVIKMVWGGALLPHRGLRRSSLFYD